MVFGGLFETFILTKDYGNVFNNICNYLFDLNRDWYAKDEHNDNGNLIQQPPPLEDVYIDEQGRRNFRHELYNHHRRQEDRIFDNNREVPDIIHLTEDNNTRPPMVSPVSDDDSSVDSLLGHAPTESEGDFSLLILMMGCPIPHLLIIRFHHHHSLHLQILIKREIYIERDLQLSLGANTRANNGLKQFMNKATIVK